MSVKIFAHMLKGKWVSKLTACGKPSTWLPREGLVDKVSDYAQWMFQKLIKRSKLSASNLQTWFCKIRSDEMTKWHPTQNIRIGSWMWDIGSMSVSEAHPTLKMIRIEFGNCDFAEIRSDENDEMTPNEKYQIWTYLLWKIANKFAKYDCGHEILAHWVFQKLSQHSKRSALNLKTLILQKSEVMKMTKMTPSEKISKR